MIARGNIPSAIFAADDVIALGVIRALKEAGYNVPDDVSVIGYDDQSFAQEVHPALTTIRQPHGSDGTACSEDPAGHDQWQRGQPYQGAAKA